MKAIITKILSWFPDHRDYEDEARHWKDMAAMEMASLENEKLKLRIMQNQNS